MPDDDFDITFRDATREDLPRLVGLLANDHLGSKRERFQDPLPDCYNRAFDAIDGDPNNPRETMQAALNLSRSRAIAVRDAIVAYASEQGMTLDPSQIQPVGVGVSEPLIAKPTNLGEAKQNMRVEFRLIKVPAEAVRPSDFDF